LIASLVRRQDARTALAQPDRRRTVTSRPPAQDDLVAVLEETALLAVRQGDRLAAARRDLVLAWWAPSWATVQCMCRAEPCDSRCGAAPARRILSVTTSTSSSIARAP
jgi:hypothetical protein